MNHLSVEEFKQLCHERLDNQTYILEEIVLGKSWIWKKFYKVVDKQDNDTVRRPQDSAVVCYIVCKCCGGIFRFGGCTIAVAKHFFTHL